MPNRRKRFKMIPVSLHALGRAFLAQEDVPVRSRIVGPFTIMWQGKPGDVRLTADTSLFFAESASPDVPHE